jgi:uncharacterized protein (DUF302 family)
MTGYAITRTVPVPFDEAVERTRAALAEQGFGVLTEIDVAATMKAKLGVDVPPQVILGACNPPLAHQALQLEESIGVLLPCNVVVRADGPVSTIVEAIDPGFLVAATANPHLETVATEAATRLRAALAALGTG